MARRSAEDAARTRASILDAALVVFAERGFAATRLDAIAERCGVTRGAFYHHFDDKHALLAAVMRERWATATAAILAPLRDSTGLAALDSFVTAYLRAVDTDPVVRALLRISTSGEVPAPAASAGMNEKRAVFDAWIALLEPRLVESGVPRSSARARAQTLLAHLLGEALWSALEGPIGEPWERRAQLVLHGLLPAPRDE